MSSPLTQEDAASLVSRFVARTEGLSLRAMGALVGVSQTKTKEWKDWYKLGADPQELADPQPGTVAALRDYLAMTEDIDARRRALRLAAERLQRVAEELQDEASEPDAGILAAARAHGATRGPDPKKRRRKGEK